MSFGHLHYVPCLRWKQGEYLAVSQLSTEARNLITPLIEIPEKGFDFENQRDKKTIDEHLKPVAARVRKHWQNRRCFVDLQLIDAKARLKGGVHPVAFLFDDLRNENCQSVPVIGISRDQAYLTEAFKAEGIDKRGFCLRINIEEAANPDLKAVIDGLLQKKNSIRECDLIMDLGAPNFSPLDGFAMLVQTLVANLPYLNNWRSFTILGSAFPSSMGEIQASPTSVARNEWKLYKRFTPELAKARVRIPAFGDYAINHPDVSLMDMRKVKPAGTLRYTLEDEWVIFKGPNVRDFGFSQYVKHCKQLASSSVFLGAGFSAGDKYISECAIGKASTGNLSLWRKIGTNHHLEKVAHDVANFSATLNSF